MWFSVIIDFTWELALWTVDFGSGGGIRTPDPVVNSHSLCRLSYAGFVQIELKFKSNLTFSQVLIKFTVWS